MIPTGRAILRGSPPKSVPLDFGLDKTFALYFYHHTTIHPNNEITVRIPLRNETLSFFYLKAS